MSRFVLPSAPASPPAIPAPAPRPVPDAAKRSTGDDPFVPFVPSAAEPWDLVKVNHLLRRVAFGPTFERQQRLLNLSPQRAVDWLLDFDPQNDDPFDGLIDQMQGLFNLNSPADSARWWIYRMLYTPRPAQERVALFWHNRFATSGAKVENGLYMHNQIELFRRKGLGSFRELLRYVTRDPAMLIWLDGRYNVRGRANENYAREIMELFTLGVGNYTEDDVKQLARAFTGWQIRGEEGVLNPKLFDDGEKQVFGKKGKFGADDAIDLILAKPAAPRFLARKMLREFLHPEPQDAHVEHYAGRLLATDWSIKTVLSELLGSRLFYSDWAYRSKIKCPADLAIGSALAMGGKANTQFLREEMSKMGQSLMYPPNVKGWDGEEAWINSNTVLVRFNLAMSITSQRRQQEYAARSDLDTTLKKLHADEAREVVDDFGRVLLDGRIEPEKRAKLIDFVDRNDKDEPAAFKPTPSWINSKVRGVLHVMMSMPEYQLA